MQDSRKLEDLVLVEVQEVLECEVFVQELLFDDLQSDLVALVVRFFFCQVSGAHQFQRDLLLFCVVESSDDFLQVHALLVFDEPLDVFHQILVLCFFPDADVRLAEQVDLLDVFRRNLSVLSESVDAESVLLDFVDVIRVGDFGPVGLHLLVLSDDLFVLFAAVFRRGDLVFELGDLGFFLLVVLLHLFLVELELGDCVVEGLGVQVGLHDERHGEVGA